MVNDVFDEILDLEEQFYNAGYQQGINDGAKAGKIEGRTFGLEQGFEKFKASGQLYGKSIIWANRFHSRAPNATLESTASTDSTPKLQLPPLPDNPRLARHIKAVHALAESESLPTENTEDAVTEFDDRLKRAQAKAKMIDRITGEGLSSDHKGEKGSDGVKSVEEASSVKISG